MKKPYVAPQLEVAVYELSTSIASNCLLVVDNGPQIWGTGHQHQMAACEKYKEITGEEDEEISTASETYNVLFYDNTCCNCYTTGSGSYWTS